MRVIRTTLPFKNGVRYVKAYQLKIAVKNSKPLIWRRCIIPAGITFGNLSHILAVSMGWPDDLSKEFIFNSINLKVNCTAVEIKDCDEVNAESVIDNIIDINETGWFTFNCFKKSGDKKISHRVTVERTIEDCGFSCPKVVKFKGNCPSDAGIKASDDSYDMDLANERLERYFTNKVPGILSDEEKFIADCFTAAAYFYGAFGAEVIVRMYNCNGQHKNAGFINADKVIKTADRAEIKTGCTYIDGIYVDNSLMSAGENKLYDDYRELLKEQGKLEYYIPTYEEIETIAGRKGLVYQPEFEKCEKFLEEKLGADEEKAGICTLYAQRRFCDGNEIQNVLNCFEENGISVKDQIQLKELAVVLNDLWNNTRMKKYRGFTPAQADKMLKERQSGKHVKIYPNDLCPCGSGKKYKKCCGRFKN